MLGIWNTLLKGEAKSTWVFMGWEGVEAQLKGVELNSFFLEPFGIPYGPSPLVIAKPDTVSGAAGAGGGRGTSASARGDPSSFTQAWWLCGATGQDSGR